MCAEKADNINASTVEAKLIANSTGEVMIKWDPPEHPNGLIIKYIIHYRRANQDDVSYEWRHFVSLKHTLR